MKGLSMKIKVNKLCECGCRKEVKEGRRFIHGHNNHETSWNKGIPISEETKLKMSISGGNRKGYKHTEETKCKMRENHANFKGRKYTEETKQKMRKPKHPGFGSILSKSTQGHFMHPDRRKKISESLKGHIPSKESNQKRSISMRMRWKDGNHAKNIQKSLHISPNKPETLLLGILEELYPGEWKFTGDFSFIINGKNPDFTNINGQKKLIELFGDYWHRGENPQDRINEFTPFGWETLVIWERELVDKNLLISKIKEFCNV